MKNRFLNIGCGSRFNRDWINIDIQPKDKSVISCDIMKGISFDDDYFDVVYHSHIIEHIEKDKVQGFLDDCYRILKPAGILRVVAPDLEQIASIYLNCLQNAYEGKPGWSENYDWMMLEMYDQVVREKSGGAMIDFLQRENTPNIDFIIERWGVEAESILDGVCYGKEKSEARHVKTNTKENSIFYKVKKILKRIKPFEIVRHWAGVLILGKEYEQYNKYKMKKVFQESGELHRWMYDKYSLTKLLTDAGFENVSVMDAQKSKIENWKNSGLDTDSDGRVFKPDSIFIEAYKPSV